MSSPWFQFPSFKRMDSVTIVFFQCLQTFLSPLPLFYQLRISPPLITSHPDPKAPNCYLPEFTHCFHHLNHTDIFSSHMSLLILVCGPLPHALESSPTCSIPQFSGCSPFYVSSSFFFSCLLQNLDDLQVFSIVYILSKGQYFKSVFIIANLLTNSRQISPLITLSEKQQMALHLIIYPRTQMLVLLPVPQSPSHPPLPPLLLTEPWEYSFLCSPPLLISSGQSCEILLFSS